jgi:hypothetical protein
MRVWVTGWTGMAGALAEIRYKLSFYLKTACGFLPTLIASFLASRPP